jgi:hypothetical protein
VSAVNEVDGNIATLNSKITNYEDISSCFTKGTGIENFIVVFAWKRGKFVEFKIAGTLPSSKDYGVLATMSDYHPAYEIQVNATYSDSGYYVPTIAFVNPSNSANGIYINNKGKNGMRTVVHAFYMME